MRTWAWIIQRASGAILVFALGLHWFVQHHIDPGVEITFAGVRLRLEWLLYLVADVLVLVFALFHGLNGLRTVILDFKVSRGAATAITVVLVLVGLGAIVYGIPPILAFLRG
ncbi:MAG TPA: hypothetical protein GX513_08305 [Firmicutes bacterium]|nr:hypothetical protein [Bacillota bacterium]